MIKKGKYKLRITRCWLVEVVDKDGYVQEYTDSYGMLNVADDYCFGTKEDAIKTGNELIKLVEKSEDGING